MKYDEIQELIVKLVVKVVELEEALKVKENSADFWFKKFQELEDYEREGDY